MKRGKQDTITCPRCGSELGHSEGGKPLRTGGVLVVEASKLRCANCKRPFEWRPGEGSQKKAVAPRA